MINSEASDSLRVMWVALIPEQAVRRHLPVRSSWYSQNTTLIDRVEAAYWVLSPTITTPILTCWATRRRNSLPSNSVRHPHMIAAFAKHTRLNTNINVQSMGTHPDGWLQCHKRKQTRQWLYAYIKIVLRLVLKWNKFTPSFEAIDNLEAALNVISTPDRTFLLCAQHYQEVYRQFKCPQPCVNCGVKPRSGTYLTRHSPDASTVTRASFAWRLGIRWHNPEYWLHMFNLL